MLSQQFVDTSFAMQHFCSSAQNLLITEIRSPAWLDHLDDRVDNFGSSELRCVHSSLAALRDVHPAQWVSVSSSALFGRDTCTCVASKSKGLVRQLTQAASAGHAVSDWLHDDIKDFLRLMPNVTELRAV